MKTEVTVWMTAYNHEKYLADCLDNVLNQKTDFEFEIVLGEDCSEDRTREIAIHYGEKFPEKIKLFLPEKNIGMMEMDAATWRMCNGRYIALLNGDDYWTDKNKLQIQFDFLESNKDAVMCFHKAKVENETDGTSFETIFPEAGETLTAESLLQGYNPIMTPTVMMRNIIDMPDWYTSMPYGDMPLYLLLSEKGKIKYIDRMMSVYRIHTNGQWQGDSAVNNLIKDLKFYEEVNKRFDYRYDSHIQKIFARRYLELVKINIKKNNFDEGKSYFSKLISSDEEFLNQNKQETEALKNILFKSDTPDNYEIYFNEPVKWKVN